MVWDYGLNVSEVVAMKDGEGEEWHAHQHSDISQVQFTPAVC